MGLLELAPTPEQNSKHCAPPNPDYFLSGARSNSSEHGFSNDSLNTITKPPEAGPARGPRLRAVERRRTQRQSNAQGLPKPAFAGIPKLCGAFGCSNRYAALGEEGCPC
eukprot:9598050-Alexandrium_andersonii.AAC.1